MADNSKFGFKNMAHMKGMAHMKNLHGFRNQAGDTSTAQFYEAGRMAADAAFQSGGVNALLSFLAGYNAQDFTYGGVDSLMDDLN